MNKQQRNILGVYTSVLGWKMNLLGPDYPEAMTFDPETTIGYGEEVIFDLLRRHLPSSAFDMAFLSSLSVEEVNAFGCRFITFRVGEDEFRVYTPAWPHYREDQLLEMFDKYGA